MKRAKQGFNGRFGPWLRHRYLTAPFAVPGCTFIAKMQQLNGLSVRAPRSGLSSTAHHSLPVGRAV